MWLTRCILYLELYPHPNIWQLSLIFGKKYDCSFRGYSSDFIFLLWILICLIFMVILLNYHFFLLSSLLFFCYIPFSLQKSVIDILIMELYPHPNIEQLPLIYHQEVLLLALRFPFRLHISSWILMCWIFMVILKPTTFFSKDPSEIHWT